MYKTLCSLLVLCCLFWGNVYPQTDKPVIPARIGVYKDKTRVVFDLDANTHANISSKGDQISIVLNPNVTAKFISLKHETRQKNAISAIEDIIFDAPKSLIILNLKKGSRLENSFEISADTNNKKNRVVLDIYYNTSKVDLDSIILASLKDSKNQNFPFNVAQNPTIYEINKQTPVAKNIADKFKPTIIIDAGHGGEDPGTIGKISKEKHINLRYALTLYKMLKATDRYNVKLTRNGDYFIKLQKRREIARHIKGDLFISLHSDSSPNISARGMTVYTLSENATDDVALRLMNQNNSNNIINGVDFSDKDDSLSRIFIDLSQRASNNNSIIFANLVLKHAKKNDVIVLHKTAKSAGFAVLQGPDIPSVLIELGFLSNKVDERYLNTPYYTNKLCLSIVHAINEFLNQKGRI